MLPRFLGAVVRFPGREPPRCGWCRRLPRFSGVVVRDSGREPPRTGGRTGASGGFGAEPGAGDDVDRGDLLEEFGDVFGDDVEIDAGLERAEREMGEHP